MKKAIQLAIACVAMMVAVTLSGCSDVEESAAGSSAFEYSSLELAGFQEGVIRVEKLALDPSLPDDGRREGNRCLLRSRPYSDFYSGTVGSELTGLEWKIKSAEKGHLTAQMAMTRAMQMANQRDMTKAYAWYQVLIHRFENPDGDRDREELIGYDENADWAESYRQTLTTIKLTPEELTQAKALAAEYIEKYVPRKE